MSLPVSYTHLDVYKRQIVLIVLPTMVIAMGDGIRDMGIHMAANSVEMEDAVGSATSVSYTHLDVYKRQVRYCTYYDRSREYPVRDVCDE